MHRGRNVVVAGVIAGVSKIVLSAVVHVQGLRGRHPTAKASRLHGLHDGRFRSIEKLPLSFPVLVVRGKAWI